MARKCTDCGIRNSHPSTPEGSFCLPCYDYAGWENQHSDDDHDGVSAGTVTYGMTTHKTRTDFNLWLASIRDDTNQCPVCRPELDPRSDTPRTGHTNTRAHSWNSHSSHGHARTPEARAACRKFMATHNGMDEITFRVAQREQELDDAFDGEVDGEVDLAAYVRDNGCMYHRDSPKHCDGKPAFRVSGDVWCATALKAARREIVIPRQTIEKL